jgi:acyl carrier protein
MSREEVLDVLTTNMRSIIRDLNGHEIQESQSLVSDFGADSLQIVEVVGRTMRDLKVRIRRTEMSSAKNIGDLVDLFVKGA